VRFEKDGREFVIIDTAGILRRKHLKDSIEFYSQVRTDEAIRRADVVLFVLDSSEEITRTDKKIGETIADAHRVCVVVANKWDLVRHGATTEEYDRYLQAMLPALTYAPVVFTTAKDQKNIQSVIDLAQNLHRRSLRRVTTGELNRVLDAIRDHQAPRTKGSRVPKLYYGTQVGVSPPVFAMFVNEPKFFSPTYRRYLENALREAFSFDEIPLRVFLRRRESKFHE
jgi:GTP-binding protein